MDRAPTGEANLMVRVAVAFLAPACQALIATQQVQALDTVAYLKATMTTAARRMAF